jgi:uncharacterized membrane-anchored protein
LSSPFKCNYSWLSSEAWLDKACWATTLSQPLTAAIAIPVISVLASVLIKGIQSGEPNRDDWLLGIDLTMIAFVLAFTSILQSAGQGFGENIIVGVALMAISGTIIILMMFFFVMYKSHRNKKYKQEKPPVAIMFIIFIDALGSVPLSLASMLVAR